MRVETRQAARARAEQRMIGSEERGERRWGRIAGEERRARRGASSTVLLVTAGSINFF